MTQQLSEQQRTVENAVQFRKQFKNLSMSGVRVTMVRTREPQRVIETLRQFAFGEEPALLFKSWDHVNGWKTYKKDKIADPPKTDSEISMGAAIIKMLGGVGGHEGFENGVYVLEYPHLGGALGAPAIVTSIKACTHAFKAEKKHLVLLVPPTVTLEPELEDDVSVIDFEPPSYAELLHAYDAFMEDREKALKARGDVEYKAKMPKFTPEHRERLLSIGAGMTLPEFENSLARAVVENKDALPDIPVDVVADSFSQCKMDVIKKTDVLEMMPSVPIDEIGGLGPLKDWLGRRVTSFSDEARAFGVEPPRGIVLVGPAGTGKSLVSKAISSMLGQPLIRFDVSRIFQSLVGSSEQRVRATLRLVDSMAPCVLVLDELDKVFGGTVAGMQGDSGVGQRVLGSILTWQQEREAPVFTVATANRVRFLPPELVRRGRMDEIFSVQMPTPEEREEIFRIHMKKRGHDYFDQMPDRAEAVAASEGYVGAEIESVVKDGLIDAFHLHGSKGCLTGAILARQLEDLKPMSVAFADDFQEMAEWAANNARAANSGESKMPSEIVLSRKRARQRPDAGQGDRLVDLDG